jgi:hypothetical protein
MTSSGRAERAVVIELPTEIDICKAVLESLRSERLTALSRYTYIQYSYSIVLPYEVEEEEKGTSSLQ